MDRSQRVRALLVIAAVILAVLAGISALAASVNLNEMAYLCFAIACLAGSFLPWERWRA